jgi:arginine utilization protein RocB
MGRYLQHTHERYAALGLPVINLGRAGRAHKMTERLRLGYSLDILPELLRYAINKIIANRPLRPVSIVSVRW